MPGKLTSKLLIKGELFRNRSRTWQNGYSKLSFISACCCIKQGSHYEFPSTCLQLLKKEFIHKHEFKNLAIMLLLNIKAIFVANTLVMKNDRVKLRQIWIAEIRFIVLNQLIS